MKSFIAALLLLCALPLAAADKWTLVQSRNFTLVGNASERNIRDIAESLEQFREAVTRIFPRGATPATVPSTVIIFRDDASFRPIKPLYQGKPVTAAGFFQGGPDVNYIALTAGEDAPRVVYHEFAHLLTHDVVAQMPTWFSEGLAEYYSNLVILGKDRKVQVGRPIADHMAQLNANPLIPLATLFNVGSTSSEYNEAGKQGMFYAESWALVHCLMLGANGRYQANIPAFLTLMEAGRSPVDSFQAAFETTLPEFEKELDQYARNRLTLPAVEYTFKDRLVPDVGTMVRTLSEAESQAYLGDLLLHGNRLAEAGTYLQRAIDLDPKNVLTLAATGQLKLRQGNYADARSYLQRAVESGSGNYLVHYYYAEVLDRFPILGDDAPRLNTMRSELQKARQLMPGFVPASEMLAYVDLLRHADLDEAETVSREALKVAPGRQSLQLMLAQVLVNTGQRDEAKLIATEVLSGRASEAIDRRNAQDLLTFIESSQSGPLPNRGAATRNTSAAEPDPATSAPQRKTVLESLGPVKVVEGDVINGTLTAIDCSTGMTLHVTALTGDVQLHTADPARIEFVSYTASIAEIRCGPREPGAPVRITYKPDPSGTTLGEPLIVAFTETNEVHP